jgi:hypothetical protein
VIQDNIVSENTNENKQKKAKAPKEAKVKKEKAPKAPKEPKAPKSAKKGKDAEGGASRPAFAEKLKNAGTGLLGKISSGKKTGQAEDTEKKEKGKLKLPGIAIPIRAQLIIGFMIPIGFIILIGLLSYSRASKGLTELYETSSQSALEMTMLSGRIYEYHLIYRIGVISGCAGYAVFPGRIPGRQYQKITGESGNPKKYQRKTDQQLHDRRYSYHPGYGSQHSNHAQI